MHTQWYMAICLHYSRLLLETYGMFTRKTLGHGSWESLNSHWLRVSQAPTLGLHKGNFELHLTPFLVDEKSTWKIWVMLDGIVGEFLRANLERKPTGMSNGAWGTTHDIIFKIHILILLMFKSKWECWSYYKGCILCSYCEANFWGVK